jgi:hypothetical protein
MASGVLYSFTVLPDGGESFKVEVRTRDMSRWERGVGLAPKHRSMGEVQKDMQTSVLEEICWVAATRQGLYEGNLASFRDTCDLDIADDGDDEDGEADPTQ